MIELNYLSFLNFVAARHANEFLLFLEIAAFCSTPLSSITLQIFFSEKFVLSPVKKVRTPFAVHSTFLLLPLNPIPK